MEGRRWDDGLAARSPKETSDYDDDDDDDDALAGGEVSVRSGVVMLEEVVCESNRIASKAGYRF
jgi:hypothetical protein